MPRHHRVCNVHGMGMYGICLAARLKLKRHDIDPRTSCVLHACYLMAAYYGEGSGNCNFIQSE